MTKDKTADDRESVNSDTPEASSEPICFNGIPHVIEYWRDSAKPGEASGAHLVNERGGDGAFRIIPIDPTEAT